MEKFRPDDKQGYICNKCGSSDVQQYDHEPATEEVYREVPDNHGDTHEKLVTVATEYYLDLECNQCGNRHFEAL